MSREPRSNWRQSKRDMSKRARSAQVPRKRTTVPRLILVNHSLEILR